MAYTQAEREWIFAEANKRAASNGSTVKQEIAKAAQEAGMDLSTAAKNMGWAPDYLTSTAPAASATPNLGIGSNMVVSGAGDQSAYNTPSPVQTPYKLDDTTRASIVSQAEARAKASGLTREQELYKYAQGEGINDAGVDTYMGFNPGTTANWAKTGMPAATGGGGQPAGVPAGDGRWNGDPTRNPDGSYRGGNLGIGDTGYQRNPYMDAMSRDMGSQMFDQWNRNVAPGLRSGAMATGGYGGSRQGVVEANALNDLGRNYSQALTGMYGADYTNYQNRGIQRQGQAQNYDLGLRSSDLGFASLDHNISNSNFNNQMTAANFGLGVQDYLNKNNATGIAAGTQINNAPWDYQKYLNSAGNQAGSGWNTSTTTKTGG